MKTDDISCMQLSPSSDISPLYNPDKFINTYYQTENVTDFSSQLASSLCQRFTHLTTAAGNPIYHIQVYTQVRSIAMSLISYILNFDLYLDS